MTAEELHRQLQGFINLEFLGERVSSVVCEDESDVILIAHVALGDDGRSPFEKLIPFDDTGLRVSEPLSEIISRLRTLMLHAYLEMRTEVVLMCVMTEP